MKLDKNTILLLILLIGIVWVVTNHVSHAARPIAVDHGWSPPVSVASTENGFDGGGDLYKWHDTLILVQSRYDWSSKSSSCSIIVRNNDSSSSWTQLPISGVPGDYAFYCPAFDETGDRVMFERGNAESNQLRMGVIFLRVPTNGRIQIDAESKWVVSNTNLFGMYGQDVSFSERPGRPGWLKLGRGSVNGLESYFPSCAEGFTYDSKGVAIARGPYWTGLFHSTDLGKTWQMERVSDSDCFDLSVSRTATFYYFFANGAVGKNRGGGLWVSRKSAEGNSWDAPMAVTRTVPFGVDESYSAMAEGDTIHVCWLDNRHEIKYWLSLARSGRGNYEVAYCRRKDSDASWRKATILSRGVMFAYSPSMSVEGDKIVVAWAGAQTAHPWPFEGDPSDIYYATSKDGGKTWNKPLKVTDHFKDGITSGSARVALQNGVIHLFYAQGRYDRQAQVSQQGGWPVYYQQRAFPD